MEAKDKEIKDLEEEKNAKNREFNRNLVRNENDELLLQMCKCRMNLTQPAPAVDSQEDPKNNQEKGKI